MATKDDITMIAKALAELAMKNTDSYSDTRGNRHKYEPDTEDIYGFEENPLQNNLLNQTVTTMNTRITFKKQTHLVPTSLTLITRVYPS